MRIARWSVVLVTILSSACATGAGDDEDGVIVRRDGAADGDEPGDDTSSTEQDSATEPTDSGSAGVDSAVAADTGGASDDTGSAMDTQPADTGPTACTGEEPEPNDTPSTARTLAGIDDCDTSGGTVTGVLSSSSDVDVLTFDGRDVFGCSVNPTVTASGSVRVCIRAACKSGSTELTSCKRGTFTGGECCGTAVEAEPNCTGTTSDDAKITITVRASGSSLTCAAYSLAYHY